MLTILTLLVALGTAAPADTSSRTAQDRARTAPPELPDSAWARDVCFPDERTIVIADWDGNSHTSRDAGKTWTSADMGAVVNELTIDARGVIWGLYRWHGIHEPSTASLVWSADLGTTWHELELDPETCMAEAFVPGGPELSVLAADGQLWVHSPGETETFANWRRQGRPTPDGSGRAGVRLGPLAVLAASKSKIFHSADGAATWREIHDESVVDFVAPLGGRCGLGPFEYLGVTATGSVITFTLRHVPVGEQVSCEFVSSRASRVFAPDLRVFHAVSDVQRFVLCGEARAGQALGVIADNQRAQALPGLSANQTVRARIDRGGRPWVIGKGAYRLADSGERWVLAWPGK